MAWITLVTPAVDPHSRRKQGQQRTFDEQELDQPSPSRADGQAQRQFDSA
jgi:hypothetical protein